MFFYHWDCLQRIQFNPDMPFEDDGKLPIWNYRPLGEFLLQVAADNPTPDRD